MDIILIRPAPPGAPERGAPSAGGFSLEIPPGRVSPDFAAREPKLDSVRRGPVPRFLGSVPWFLAPVLWLVGCSAALALSLACLQLLFSLSLVCF